MHVHFHEYICLITIAVKSCMTVFFLVISYLFWTDMAVLGGGLGSGVQLRQTGLLERSLLDGSRRFAITGTASDTHEASVSWPTAIALDSSAKLIYVADAYKADISNTDASAVLVFSYGGSLVRRVALQSTSSVQALALLGRSLFFADPANRRVGSFDLSTSMQRTAISVQNR